MREARPARRYAAAERAVNKASPGRPPRRTTRDLHLMDTSLAYANPSGGQITKHEVPPDNETVALLTSPPLEGCPEICPELGRYDLI